MRGVPVPSVERRPRTPSARSRSSPSCAARNDRVSTDSAIVRSTDRAECPTSVSRRSRIGGPVRRLDRLQRGAHLAGVQRVDAGVGVEDLEQRRRVGGRRVARARPAPRGTASSRAASRARSGRRRCRTRRSRSGRARTARSGPCRAAARCTPPRRTGRAAGSARRRRAGRRSSRRRCRAGPARPVRAQVLGRGVQVVEDVLLARPACRRGARPRPPPRRPAGAPRPTRRRRRPRPARRRCTPGSSAMPKPP